MLVFCYVDHWPQILNKTVVINKKKVKLNDKSKIKVDKVAKTNHHK